MIRLPAVVRHQLTLPTACVFPLRFCSRPDAVVVVIDDQLRRAWLDQNSNFKYGMPGGWE
jgi:hypothetical protein